MINYPKPPLHPPPPKKNLLFTSISLAVTLKIQEVELFLATLQIPRDFPSALYFDIGPRCVGTTVEIFKFFVAKFPSDKKCLLDCPERKLKLVLLQT